MLFYYYPQDLSKEMDDLAMQKQSSGNVSEFFSRILTRHLKELNNGKILQDSDLEKIITVEKLINWKVWSSLLKGTV